ncbi:MAG: leucine-rich repeat domain-containing protein [Ruminococcus sp.]|nr:leucine-rich repeat domain-containing protein [Ruminococcus sp.]
MNFDIKDGVLVKYNGKNPDVIIPSCVTKIGEEAFGDNYNIKSVIITGNVTAIGDRAFANCYYLEKIVIQEGVITIGRSAFENCYQLEEIVIPESVTKIGNNAFFNTKWIRDKGATEKSFVAVNGIAIARIYDIEESVNLEGIKVIHSRFFENCIHIKEFVVSDGIKIGYKAFFTGNDFNICLKHDDYSVNIPVKVSEIEYFRGKKGICERRFYARTESLFKFIGAGTEQRELLFDDLEIPEYRYPLAVFMANVYDSEFFKAFIDVHFEKIQEYAKNNDPDLLKLISR